MPATLPANRKRTHPKHEHKAVGFEILEVKANEAGTEAEFEGYASIFGNKDQGGDIVQKGAFKRTIDHNKGKFPLLADHEYTLKGRLGIGYCEEDAKGLKVRGVVNLECAAGKEVYSHLVQAKEHGVDLGMSFGYQVIKSRYDKENKARLLDEIKLYEVTITQFPMNTEAGVTDIKATFTEWLERIQEGRELNAEYWAIQDAWLYALDDAIYSSDPVDERRADLETSLAAYSAAIMDWFSRHTDYYESKDESPDGLIKSGHTTIQEHIKALYSPAPESATVSSSESPEIPDDPPDADATQKADEPAPETDPPTEDPNDDPQALQLKQLLSSLQTMNADA